MTLSSRPIITASEESWFTNQYCMRQAERTQYWIMSFLQFLPMTKLLMVCMGNVCRSSMAQIVTLHLLQQERLARHIEVDSAGTHARNSNEPPDLRAKLVLSRRGYVTGNRRSRQVNERDFGRYDLILAMDRTNLNDLRLMCTEDHAHKLRLFLDFAQETDIRDVPDPYYGSVEGFERVLDLCEAGARGLVAHYQTDSIQARPISGT